jgi:hypothetical protein
MLENGGILGAGGMLETKRTLLGLAPTKRIDYMFYNIEKDLAGVEYFSQLCGLIF